MNERSDNCVLGEDELKRQLRTHLIPYAQLAVGYDGISDDERQSHVKSDYGQFLDARAEILRCDLGAAMRTRYSLATERTRGRARFAAVSRSHTRVSSTRSRGSVRRCSTATARCLRVQLSAN